MSKIVKSCSFLEFHAQFAENYQSNKSSNNSDLRLIADKLFSWQHFAISSYSLFRNRPVPSVH